MIPRPSPDWRIEDTYVVGYPAVSFCRPWEQERITVRALEPDRVRADLRALEQIERYIGFVIRHSPVTRLDGMFSIRLRNVLGTLVKYCVVMGRHCGSVLGHFFQRWDGNCVRLRSVLFGSWHRRRLVLWTFRVIA